MMHPHRRGMTLFEVAISMAILSVAVIATMLAIAGGSKAQTAARMQMYAAARAMQLIDAWAQQPFTASYQELEVSELGQRGVSLIQDLEHRLLSSPTGGTYRGWGGIRVVPPEIARRIDSPDDEIARILNEGGQLYYFPKSGIQVGGDLADNFTDELSLGSESHKLVFAVRGKPQQNAVHSHPLNIFPTVEYYAFPPQPWHARVWYWNTERKAPVKRARRDEDSDGIDALSLGCVSRIIVTDPGYGYSVPPTVHISPPENPDQADPDPGRRAQARALVANGLVTAIQITDPGSGYRKTPTVTITSQDDIGRGATAEAGIYNFLVSVGLDRNSRGRYLPAFPTPAENVPETVAEANPGDAVPAFHRNGHLEFATSTHSHSNVSEESSTVRERGNGYLRHPGWKLRQTRSDSRFDAHGHVELAGDDVALVDYRDALASVGAGSDGITAEQLDRLAAWPDRYPDSVVDWDAANAAFWDVYNACYHFRQADAADMVKADDTWVGPPNSRRRTYEDGARTDSSSHEKALKGRSFGQYPANIRNPANRYAARAVAYRDTAAGIVRHDPAAPQPSDYRRNVDYRSDNFDVALGNDLETGAGARYREFLTRAQRLVHEVFPQGDGNGTRLTATMRDYGGVSNWVLPHPPCPLADFPTPWAADNEQVYPPSFKILALSYLTYAAHIAASRSIDTDPATLRGFTQTGIAHIAVDSGGVSYDRPPTIAIDPPPGSIPPDDPRLDVDDPRFDASLAADVDPTSYPAAARGRIDRSSDTLLSIDVEADGGGYDPARPPQVTVVAHPLDDGRTATATATVGWNNVPGGHAELLSNLDEYARDLNDLLIAYGMRYASAEPYDWGAPRPLNRQTAWDYPLLQYDLFPTGPHRPEPSQVGVEAIGAKNSLPFGTGNTPATLPAPKHAHCSGDLDLVLSAAGFDPDVVAARAPYSVFDRTGTTLRERWLTERQRPGWRRGNPVRKDRFHDGNRWRDGFFANRNYNESNRLRLQGEARIESDPNDIDREWKLIAERQPHSWGPARALSGWGGSRAEFWPKNSVFGRRISQHVRHPGAPSDHDNSDNLWYSWGDHSRFNLTAPFAATERCRELVFFSVDWQQYEDFETAQEAPLDARDIRNHSTRGSTQDYGLSLTGRHDQVEMSQYIASGWVDRNENGRAGDLGSVPASVRLQATPVASFAFYDSRLFGALRR